MIYILTVPNVALLQSLGVVQQIHGAELHIHKERIKLLEEEIANIVTNNIPVYFLDSYIYLDDTHHKCVTFFIDSGATEHLSSDRSQFDPKSLKNI